MIKKFKLIDIFKFSWMRCVRSAVMSSLNCEIDKKFNTVMILKRIYKLKCNIVKTCRLKIELILNDLSKYQHSSKKKCVDYTTLKPLTQPTAPNSQTDQSMTAIEFKKP